MIKILKEGTKKVAICESCGCKFSYDREDVEVIDIPCQEYEEYIKCPQCKVKVDVYNINRARDYD